jgi:nitrous oxide reductase
MAKKPDSDQKERKLQREKAVSRRDFVKAGAVAGIGAAAGVGATVVSTSRTALSQVRTSCPAISPMLQAR